MTARRPSYLSWSQVETLAGCGRKYELRYVEKMGSVEKGYFIGGNAIHTTIAESEGAGWWGNPELFAHDGEAVAFFRNEVARLVAKAGGAAKVEWGGRKTKEFPEGENQDWWNYQGAQMLRRYSSLRQEDNAKGREAPKTEVQVKFTHDGQLVLGYIDQLFNSGRIDDRVRDYKTGAKYSPDTPLQLALYGYAVRQTLGVEVRWGEFIYLRSTDGRLVYEVDLTEWYDLIPILLEEAQVELERGVFTHRPGWQCKTCDVAPFCEVGRRLVERKLDGEGQHDEAPGVEATVPS